MADEVLPARDPARVGGLVPACRGTAAADVHLVGLAGGDVGLAVGGLPGLTRDARPGGPAIVGVVGRVDPHTHDRDAGVVGVAQRGAADGGVSGRSEEQGGGHGDCRGCHCHADLRSELLEHHLS